MQRLVTVAAAQLGPTDENKAATVERMTALVHQAGKQQVQIICFPELALMPFFPARLIKDNDYIFDDLPSPLTESLFAAVREHRVAMVLPYAEASGIAHYNSALFVDGVGKVVGKYRKVHIPAYFPGEDPVATGSFERLYFTPGNLGFPVYELAGVKVGVQICYDRLFPEGSRALALKGAEICFYPNNMAMYRDAYRATVWPRLLQTRAYENCFYAVAPNKAGREPVPADALRQNEGLLRDNVGDSLIIGPLEGGEILTRAETDGDELVVATLDLEQVRTARQRLPYWRDRRPDAYGDLTS